MEQFDVFEREDLHALCSRMRRRITRSTFCRYLRQKLEVRLTNLIQGIVQDAQACKLELSRNWRVRRQLGSLILLSLGNVTPFTRSELSFFFRVFGRVMLKTMRGGAASRRRNRVFDGSALAWLRMRLLQEINGGGSRAGLRDAEMVVQSFAEMELDPLDARAESRLKAHRRLVLWLGAGCTLREVACYEGVHLEEVESNMETFLAGITSQTRGLGHDRETRPRISKMDLQLTCCYS